MSHLNNVYKLACELRIETALAIREGHHNHRYGSVDRELSRLIDWALANLPDGDVISETAETNENANHQQHH